MGRTSARPVTLVPVRCVSRSFRLERPVALRKDGALGDRSKGDRPLTGGSKLRLASAGDRRRRRLALDVIPPPEVGSKAEERFGINLPEVAVPLRDVALDRERIRIRVREGERVRLERVTEVWDLSVVEAHQ